MSWREQRGGRRSSSSKSFSPRPTPHHKQHNAAKEMMNTLVASSSQMISVPRLRAAGARSSARVAAVRPPMMAMTHAKGKKFSVVAQALGNNKNDDGEKQQQQQKRGSKASGLSASRNPQAAAASSAIEVIPGDYRIGGVLLSVAAFLGPVCHLWTQFGVHGILAGERARHTLDEYLYTLWHTSLWISHLISVFRSFSSSTTTQ